MEKIKLTAEASVVLGVNGEVDEQAVSAAIVSLDAKLKAEKARAEALQSKMDAQAKAAATAMVEKAIAEGRIDAMRKESFITLATTDPELAKATLEAIPAKRSISEEIKGIRAGSDTIPEDRKSWRLLDWLKNDPKGIARIKAEQPDVYETIRQAGR